MTGERRWEYCELGLGSSREHKPGIFGGKQGRSYDCYIRYHTPEEPIFQMLAQLDEPIPYNPFSKAIGLLGLAGWELVSVQHGNSYGGQSSRNEDAILWNNQIAYFKRPVIPGRAINEPKLDLG